MTINSAVIGVLVHSINMMSNSSARRFISNITLVIELCDKLTRDIQLMRDIVQELAETLTTVEHDTSILELTAKILRRQFAVCEDE